MTQRAAPTKKSPTKAYLARAKAFAETIDLATAVRTAAHGRKADARITKFEQQLKALALAPDRAFASLASLKYLEVAFFTYWNECPEPHIATFWHQVAKRKLPYRLRDWAAEALTRGRITSQVEYEAITDAIGDDHFSQAETIKLESMLSAYALKTSKRAKRARQ